MKVKFFKGVIYDDHNKRRKEDIETQINEWLTQTGITTDDFIDQKMIGRPGNLAVMILYQSPP